MQIFLTYDYEIFFGNPTGTADQCIIHPTNELRKISNNTGVKFVFFIDVGYIKKLNEFRTAAQQVETDYLNVTNQIKSLVDEGHDCQLHIHPHWEDCKHDGTKWKMNTDRYKLTDFNDQEIEQIVLEYQQILADITGKEVNSFRAGGWCLQPFARIQSAFLKARIKLDSTVFPGGKFTAGNYYYDFTESPKKSIWKFSDNLRRAEPDGDFWEYPISSHFYNPLFFWKLFALGRLNPDQHKPMGDGYPMDSPGLRKQMLTKGKLLSASSDGYFVTKLDKILRANEKKGYNEMVVLGHPKACTKFALKKLETFIVEHQNKHEFMTFADLNL